jgi:iron complex outermembrane recepter protein
MVMSAIKQSSRRFLISSCALVALAGGVGSAHAQSGDQAVAGPAASGGGLEEIVVTAERRSTNIQKTALSISALKADTLEKSNVVQLADINGRVPSLTITKSSGYETVTTIRGIGYETTENEGATTPGVALFIDGVYIANTIALDQTLFDIDHLEVLRGPQGALYGQSSTGGAISIITKQPVLNEFSGTADGQFGDYNLHRERAEINVPLGDTFAIRASVQNYGHDGFTKDNFFKNYYLDDANDMSGKLAVLWAPTDDFKATLSTEFYSSDFNGASQKNIKDPNPDPWTVTQDYPSRFALNTNISHLNLEWDLPWFTVKSVSAYQYLDHHQQEDSSRSAFDVLGQFDDVAAWNTKMYNYNEEFDLISNGDTNFDWTTGVFLLSQKFQQYVAEFGGNVRPTPAQLIPKPDVEDFGQRFLNFGQKVVSDKRSYAWFAQGTYHFTDDLRLVGGVRVNYDSYDFYTKNFGLCTPGTPPGQCPGYSKASYWDLVPTWIGRLEYDLTPDNMLYASYSRGYKPGGSNGVGLGYFYQHNPSFYGSFQPETNTSFEVGAKNAFLDKHLTVNVSAFYYLYKNMQFLYTDPIPFSGGIGNIPSTHIWGGEIESSYTGGPEDRLKIDASLSAEDGEIQGDFNTLDSTILNRLAANNANCGNGGQFFNPACWAAELKAQRNIGGNMPPKMPSVQASIAISYDFPVYAGTLTPRVEYIYRGQMWARVFAEPSVDNIPSYDLVNLNFEYVPDDSQWKVDFAVTNLFNEAGVNSKYTDPYGSFQTSEQFIPPRQIMGTISYKFGGPVSEPETPPAAYVPPPAVAPAVPKSYLVFFDFNKSDLTPQAVEIVDTAAKNAGPAKVTQLTVTGHTDTVGSDAYNMRLSRRRAESVAAQLEKDGIPSSEIEIVAKGKRDLLVPTADGVKEPQNRRVQIVYSGEASS